MGDEPTDDGISTANTNVRIAADHRLQYESHDRAITITGIEEPRDLIVMTNRITDEHGDVTGMDRITAVTTIIYCNNH